MGDIIGVGISSNGNIIGKNITIGGSITINKNTFNNTDSQFKNSIEEFEKIINEKLKGISAPEDNKKALQENVELWIYSYILQRYLFLVQKCYKFYEVDQNSNIICSSSSL